MFSIRFSDEHPPGFDPRDWDTRHRFVVTVLGEYEDRSPAPLSFWDEVNYQAQWREGAERLLSGAESSCLVRRMEDPENDAQHVHWWDLYRVGDDGVVVQSSIWSAAQAGGPLDPRSIYDAVLPYTAKIQDGLPPLEWRIGIADFADWLSTA